MCWDLAEAKAESKEDSMKDAALAHVVPRS
jgi:hypothetical protein